MLKKVIILALALVSSSVAIAKKVKFSVDMTGLTISVNGMHIGGDFQVLAGYPGDFESNTTLLTQEGTSDIYSIIVDLPAFAKYEYKFINGDQWYEAEFVPVESRVGYNFDDNRWIYVDSLADDTTDIGAVIFAANAPANNYLVRYYVDMALQTPVDPAGVYVKFATAPNSWNTMRMYNFDNTNYLYEIIGFSNAQPVQYQFSKGLSNFENPPSACTNNSYREVAVSYDSLLATVCYSECAACLTGINKVIAKTVSLYPNPMSEYTTMDIGKDFTNAHVVITDITGKKVSEFTSGSPVRIEKNNLQEGVYSVYVSTDDSHQYNGRFIVK